ncbi:MAG: hypothetical protein O3B87_04505 [bacterium]|nr:hypothetical protein [bacterium]
MKTNTKKPFLNPFEQVAEFAKDTVVTTAKELVKTVNPLSELFINPTQKEREKGNNNFTELDFDKLQKQYSQQDNPDLEAIRAQLGADGAGGNEVSEDMTDEQLKAQFHKRVMREEEEENLREEQEKEENERQKAMEAQQQAQAEAANAQPLETPKGKVHKNILGGGRPKATSELPPEIKPDAGRG